MITDKEITKMAKLAKFDFTKDELDIYAKQITNIMDMIDDTILLFQPIAIWKKENNNRTYCYLYIHVVYEFPLDLWHNIDDPKVTPRKNNNIEWYIERTYSFFILFNWCVYFEIIYIYINIS